MAKTSAEIKRIRERVHEDLMIRLDPKATPTAEGGRMHIMICCGTGCTSSGSLKIVEGLEERIRGAGL